MNKRGILVSYAAVAAFTLSACGGESSSGDSPTPPPTTISGIAAAGAPIIGTVKIKDSVGAERNASISSDGSFSIDTAGMTAPFILMAEGTVAGRAYSIASPATSNDIGGTVNVTPLTDVILGNVMGRDSEEAYQAGGFSNITDSNVTAQDVALGQALSGILTDAGSNSSNSIINTSFSADHSGIDLAMDMLNVEVNRSTDVATISLVDGSSSVTDDLTVQTTLSSLSTAGDSTAAITEYNSILSVINNFVSDLNNGIAAPTLASDYFAGTFLDDGIDSTVFLSNLGAGGSPALAMSNIAVTSLDLTPGSEVAVIRFMVSFGGVIYDSADMQLIKDATKGWIFNGNRKLASVSLRSYVERKSTYQRGVSETTVYSSGLSLSMDIVDADDNGINNGITQATLTGPGITGSVTLLPHTNLTVRFVNGSSWNGFIPISDPNIATIKEGDIYTLVVDYNDGSAKQETYQLRLNKPPLSSAQLMSQSYTTITTPASATALDNASGNLSVSWTLGDDLTPFDVDARSSCVGGDYGSTDEVLSSDTSVTMTNTRYLSAESCQGVLRFTSLDKFNGEVVTTYEITN